MGVNTLGRAFPPGVLGTDAASGYHFKYGFAKSAAQQRATLDLFGGQKLERVSLWSHLPMVISLVALKQGSRYRRYQNAPFVTAYTKIGNHGGAMNRAVD